MQVSSILVPRCLSNSMLVCCLPHMFECSATVLWKSVPPPSGQSLNCLLATKVLLPMCFWGSAGSFHFRDVLFFNRNIKRLGQNWAPLCRCIFTVTVVKTNLRIRSSSSWIILHLLIFIYIYCMNILYIYNTCIGIYIMYIYIYTFLRFAYLLVYLSVCLSVNLPIYLSKYPFVIMCLFSQYIYIYV